MLGVDGEIGAQFLRQRQFAVINIDRADQQTHRLGILNSKVSEAAAARDRDPLTRLCFRLLDSLVGRDAGANERRSFGRRETFRDMCHIIRIGKNVFRETTVLGVAAELRFGTNCLPGA